MLLYTLFSRPPCPRVRPCVHKSTCLFPCAHTISPTPSSFLIPLSLSPSPPPPPLSLTQSFLLATDKVGQAPCATTRRVGQGDRDWPIDQFCLCQCDRCGVPRFNWGALLAGSTGHNWRRASGRRGRRAQPGTRCKSGQSLQLSRRGARDWSTRGLFPWCRCWLQPAGRLQLWTNAQHEFEDKSNFDSIRQGQPKGRLSYAHSVFLQRIWAPG